MEFCNVNFDGIFFCFNQNGGFDCLYNLNHFFCFQSECGGNRLWQDMLNSKMRADQRREPPQ